MARIICQRSSDIWPKSAKLLGLAIYKIQEVWKRLDELWQANYTLRALPKGLKFLWVVPPSESPMVMGLVSIHNLDAPLPLQWFDPLPLVWEGGPEWGNICTWCTTGSAWCATNVRTTHQPHQTLSAAMAGRTVYPLERESLMSQLCQSNHQQGTGRINLSSLGIWMEESRGTGFPQVALSGTPSTHWRRSRWRRHHLLTCNVLSPVFSTHPDQEAACYLWIMQDICQQCWTL